MNSRMDLPLARFYRGEASAQDLVCEGTARFGSFPYSERHLQCVWYDPVLRPTHLTTHEGETVIVEDPGTWNLEAGPDFLGAVLRVGAGERRMRGDVEIHIHPRDWTAHGHRQDRRYANVIAHVTYFPGSIPSSELPPGALQLSLRPALAMDPGFSFESIDVFAYPFSARAPVPPCQAELANWHPDEKQLVLDAAGQERIRRKAERLAIRIEESGLDQTVYEETLAVLGYKHNKLPFRALAHRLPLHELRERSAGDSIVAQALMLGVAGLLPDRMAPSWDEETKHRVRFLWDIWFRHRDRWAGRCMSREAWRFAGIRPANHPLRRIAAAASLFASPSEPWQRALEHSERDPASAAPQAARWLTAASDPYWERRAGWANRISSKSMALIGKDRADLFVANVWIPLLFARGRLQGSFERLLESIKPESDHQILRQTAMYLFGPNHPRSWYQTAMRRQGLVQIFQDYCLTDRSRCASCGFPALLQAWRARREKAG